MRPSSAVVLLCCACVTVASYPGKVKYFFCDMKTSLNSTQLTVDNYKAVIDGFRNNMHCNGVRVPLLPTLAHPEKYAEVYHAAFHYARTSGMAIYSNPMEHAHDIINDYSAWVAEYANYFKPDFLGVFNEAGSCDPDCMLKVVPKIRGLLSEGVNISFVGFDKMHVDGTVKELKQNPKLLDLFDVISSHNAGGDSTATTSMWQKLKALADGVNKPLWSSENPDTWAAGPYSNLTDSINAGVTGLVTWKTFNKLVGADGSLTKAGEDIAPHFA
eukprot:Hpha_TRINITY_DN24242_c0_g1::TRINITY_DN24242_c0_g1_i1::g.36018::m.36018